MAVFFPDIIQHNNPNLAVADSDFLRGGRRIVANLTALYALVTQIDQLKAYVTIVYVTSEQKEYILIDVNNIGNSSGWQIYKDQYVAQLTEVVEKLTVTATNTLSALTNTATATDRALLLVNGIIYDTLGTDGAFSISGTTVTWLNSNIGFNLETTDRVLIRYFK